MKKDRKDKIKKMSVKELQQELKKLEKEEMIFQTYMLTKNGSSLKVRNYPVVKEQDGGLAGNIKRIKKEIAVIKTFLTIRMKH